MYLNSYHPKLQHFIAFYQLLKLSILTNYSQKVILTNGSKDHIKTWTFSLPRQSRGVTMSRTPVQIIFEYGKSFFQSLGVVVSAHLQGEFHRSISHFSYLALGRRNLECVMTTTPRDLEKDIIFKNYLHYQIVTRGYGWWLPRHGVGLCFKNDLSVHWSNECRSFD